MISRGLRKASITVCSSRRRQRLFHSSGVLSVLHHEWIGGKDASAAANNESDDAIIFLHGLLGNGKNLKTLAKKVVEAHNDNDKNTSGLLLDLRGHGRSTHGNFEGQHTFESCVADLDKTLQNNTTNPQTPPSLVMGHSWGGRIALQYVHSLLSNNQIDPSSLPSLWLLDTIPGQAHDSVLQVLNAVQQIDFVNKTRSDVAQELVDHGLDKAIAQWLASTLQQDKETKMLRWGFDVDVVREIMPEFQNQDFLGMLQDILVEGGNVHLIKGGRNTAWEESPRIALQLNELQETHPWQFEQHTLPDAGHWVHVDDLPGLLNIVQEKAT